MSKEHPNINSNDRKHQRSRTDPTTKATIDFFQWCVFLHNFASCYAHAMIIMKLHVMRRKHKKLIITFDHSRELPVLHRLHVKLQHETHSILITLFSNHSQGNALSYDYSFLCLQQKSLLIIVHPNWIDFLSTSCDQHHGIRQG